jgi:hypothetical protein
MKFSFEVFQPTLCFCDFEFYEEWIDKMKGIALKHLKREAPGKDLNV